ncbi:hypothetical protein PDE_01808 [Penicillium oxalicum 114-2]|uniref:Thioredoxin n=1 Tax=Penicillium oxalicum (strain 114-2 / CGMCC 5302) TaxID=933388 RepID=S8ALZ0_PENO1|nr:hypothetical protein PDE_01808 [Penicillium oxalicum 114-2]
MSIEAISSKQEFLDKILNSDGLIVLDAWAPWCGPCRLIAPKIEEFSQEYPNVQFYKVDVEAVPDVAQEIGARAMPTFYFFKKGEKINEVIGANPGAVRSGIESLMAA